MEGDCNLHLTDREIGQVFSDPAWAAKFPPILTIQQAADLLQAKLGTIRDWRSRGLLTTCSRKVGKEVKFWRDRLIKAIFNEGVASSDE